MSTVTARMVQSRPVRVLFLGMATLAAAPGSPVKVDPPPKRRTPVGVVRDEDGDAGIRLGGVR
jgi:hypothetical protein